MLIQFENEEIEIIYINNELFFKVKDVCKILGFKNPRDALNTHCEKEGVASADTLTSTGKKKANFINEPNLYALIFNVPKIFHTDTAQEKENKIKAEKFKRFIFKEVLPSIRKTGSYSIAKKLNPEEHKKRQVQVENSKIINAVNYEKGGVDAIKDYCVESCKKITGKRPSEWKKIGKEIGLKSKQTGSGKEVLRNVESLKKYACALSVSDNLKAMGYDLESATECAKAGLSFFDKLLSMGVQINDK